MTQLIKGKEKLSLLNGVFDLKNSMINVLHVGTPMLVCACVCMCSQSIDDETLIKFLSVPVKRQRKLGL